MRLFLSNEQRHLVIVTLLYNDERTRKRADANSDHLPVNQNISSKKQAEYSDNSLWSYKYENVISVVLMTGEAVIIF